MIIFCNFTLKGPTFYCLGSLIAACEKRKILAPNKRPIHEEGAWTEYELVQSATEVNLRNTDRP